MAATSPPSRLAWVVLLIAILALSSGVFVLATGGGRFDVAGLRLSVRSPWPSLSVAALALALLVAWRRRRLGADLVEADAWMTRAAPALGAGLAAVTLLVAVRLGSSVAGGADSSGYLSQAQRWREASLHVEIPAIAEAPWPDAARTFSPLGYRPGPGGRESCRVTLRGSRCSWRWGPGWAEPAPLA